MIIAIRDVDKEEVFMDKSFTKNGDLYKCKCCNLDIIAKCGDFKKWHFAHKSLKECLYSKKASSDNSMSEFHREYQKAFFKIGAKCEKVFDKNIADVFHNDRVYEIQHSLIKPIIIKNRNEAYKTLTGKPVIWIINGETQRPQNFPNESLVIVYHKTEICFCFDGSSFYQSIDSIEDSLIYITNHQWIHETFVRMNQRNEFIIFKEAIKFVEEIGYEGQIKIDYHSSFEKIYKAWKAIKDNDVNKRVKIDLIREAFLHKRILYVVYHSYFSENFATWREKETLNFLLSDIESIEKITFGTTHKDKTPMHVFRNDRDYFNRWLYGVFINPNKPQHEEAKRIVKKLVSS